MQGEIPDFQKEEVTKNLYRHVEYLSVKVGERHLWRNDSLSQAAEYIQSVLTSYGYEVWCQTYRCYGKKVLNLIVEKKGTDEEALIIGAHYDTVPGTPGADDNASGLAGLLELARLNQPCSNKKTLVFAAFERRTSLVWIPAHGEHGLRKTLKGSEDLGGSNDLSGDDRIFQQGHHSTVSPSRHGIFLP